MTSRWAMNAFAAVAPKFTWLMNALIPGRDAEVLAQESRNKGTIMTLVNAAVSYVDEKFSTPVQKIVEKCYALGPFPALWAIEGVGKDIADWHMNRNTKPTRIMQDVELDPKWDGAWLMLHAGIGMAFAKYYIDRMKSRSDEEVRVAVEAAVDLCRANSRAGYFGAAMESLGLVSRFMGDGAYCRRVDKELERYAPDCRGFFWRGCGRALYFHPGNFFPPISRPSRALINVEVEGPDELARQNLTAGIAWAQTVVNMNTPQVMEWVLKHQDQYFGTNPAFVNGVISSVVMRYDTSPDLPLIKEFMNHKPSDPAAAALWATQIKASLEAATGRIHTVLKQNHRLDEVFHYQDLPALVSRLESGVEASRNA